MRIALVVTGGLHPSGREQVVPALLWFVERLARSHEVHAFALSHLPRPQQYDLRGATVHDLGRPAGPWRRWRALQRALDETGPFEVVHGYQADPAGLLAVLTGRRRRIPSIVTCNSGEFVALPAIDYGLQRSLRGRALVRGACRWATRVHVESAYMEALARDRGIDCVRIPLGVDVGSVSAPAGRAEGPPWRLLQVASLNRVKDQGTLLDAVALVRRSHDVRLDVVGEDTLGLAVQRRAQALGIADFITFHGFVPQDRLRDIRNAAHVYVQSSLHEAAGVAVLEAAAAGLPIVGTNVGYLRDWNGTAATAVPPGNAEALAEAITLLLNEPARRAALAAAARRASTEYDADETTRRMVALYESLRELSDNAPDGH